MLVSELHFAFATIVFVMLLQHHISYPLTKATRFSLGHMNKVYETERATC